MSQTLSPTSAAPIEVVAARKTFPGAVHALNGVTFTIGLGERACLLGPNGAGKTTLIRLLTGALRPTTGYARIFGCTSDAPNFLAAKRRVGIVPQSPGMYRDLSVQEYLELVRQLYGRGDVAEIVDAFGLQAYRTRPMAQLSGGYQRRLVLAAALLPQPDLLLLDEPTVGLDPVAARQVHDYLRTMMAGRTTLLCTHNLAEAEALCDTVVILRDGHVLVHESLAQLRTRVHPELELAAVEGPSRLAGVLMRLGHAPQIADGVVRLALAHPQSQAPALLKVLLAAGLQVYECHVSTPTLEDLFLDIVGGRNADA